MPASFRPRTYVILLSLTALAAALVLDTTPTRGQFRDNDFNQGARSEHRAPTDRERDFLDVLGMYYPMRVRDFVALAVNDANPDTFAATLFFRISDREIGEIKVTDPEAARRIWDRTSALPTALDRRSGIIRFSDLLTADADAVTVVNKHNPGERPSDMDITVHFARVYGSAAIDFRASDKLPSNRVLSTFASLRQFMRE
jgi:hypothetical protein